MRNAIAFHRPQKHNSGVNEPSSNPPPAPAGKRRTLLRAPLLPPGAALVAGIWAGLVLPLPPTAWCLLLVAGLLAAGLGLARPGFGGLALAGVLLGCVALGAVRMQVAWDSLPADDIARATAPGKSLATLRGRVVSYPQLYLPEVEFGYQPEPSLVFLLRAEGLWGSQGLVPASGLARVSIDEPYAVFRPGQRVELAGWLSRPRPASNPGQFDAQHFGRLTGIRARLRVPTEQCARKLPDDSAGPMRWLWRWRAAMRQYLAETGSRQTGRLISALVLGQRHPALSTLERAMQQAGLAHYMSISGLHLGIFLGFCYALCRALGLGSRRTAAVVLVLLGGYVLLAESRPPLLRSAVMAACFLLAILRGRPAASLNALAAAAILLLLIDPRQLLLPGFQLSFIIVGGLILLGRRMREVLFARWLHRRGLMVYREPGRLGRWFGVQLVEQACTAVTLVVTAWLLCAPLAAMHFGYLSPWAPLLSLLLFPLVLAVLIPAYAALGLAGLLPNLAAGLADLAALPAEALQRFVASPHALPGLCLTVRPVGWGWVLLNYATVLALLYARRSRPRRVLAGTLLAGLLAWTVLLQWPARPPARTAELNLLAVGAGQCAVIQTPAGNTFLFDAGTRSGFDAYHRVLAPFLRERKLPDPDLALVSHANTDHYSALPGLVRDGRCDTALLCDYFDRNAENPFSAPARLMRLLLDHDVDVRRLRKGDRLQLDPETAVEVLWPPPGVDDLVSNDTSLVLKIHCGGRTVLLPGDIDERAQSELLAEPDRLNSDVLVMPHHGGWEKTLPAFVQAVAPQVILASGHRDPMGPSTAHDRIRDFYRRLRKDYRFFSTSSDGWLGVQFGPAGVNVQTMNRRRKTLDPR